MGSRVKIEIKGRDEFWRRAFHVEWEYQFPGRSLVSEGDDRYLVDAEWLEDLRSVGAQCFCKILEAPADPARRTWIRSLIRTRR